MVSIFVADDEYNVVRLVKKIIDCPDVCVIGEAYNGIDTYRKIEELEPDILITDICMPGLSGIELIEKVKIKYPEMDVIIISGYQDFEYAHAALKFGVQEYLLKPIKKEELNSVLKGLVEKKNNKRIEKKKINHWHVELRKKYLYECAFRTKSGDELENSKMSGLFKNSDNMHICILKMDLSEWGDITEEQQKDIMGNVNEKLYSQFMESCTDVEYIGNGTKTIFFISLGNDSDVATNKNKIHLLEQIKSILKNENYKYGFLRFVMAFGSGFSSEEGMKESFDTALRTIEKRINKDAGIVIDYQDTKKRYYFGQRLSLTSCDYKKITQLTEKRNAADIMDYLENCMQIIEDKYKDKGCRYGLAMDAVNCVFSALNEMGFTEEKDYYNFSYAEKMVNDSSSSETMMSKLSEYIEKLFRCNMEQQNNKESKTIRLIKEYIEQNYNMPLTLEMVAREVCLSPVYLSALFKTETGVGFCNYLLEVRIEHAKNLLRTTNIGIGDVAYSVGYTDARHFSKLFKKQTGINPVEYRKFFS